MEEKTYVCPECENEIKVDMTRDYEVGDVIECDMCGTELEVVNVTDAGDLDLEIIEEEK